MTAADDLSATVLVTVDSLRADALGGDAADHAPAIASLARRGTTFENAFAHGNWTPFSFPSLLGARHVFADDDDIGVADAPTLAETLADAGVSTAGFNAANGFLTDYWGYDRGFDEFRTFIGDVDDSVYSRYLSAHPTVQARLRLAGAPVRRVLGRDGPDPVVNASRLLDVERHAVDFIADAEPPFFLWIHYMDVHTPYVPAPEYVRRVTGERTGLLSMFRGHARAGLGLGVGDRTLEHLRSLYRAAVAQVDDSVARVLDALEERGIREETCVVFAGDHGEEFQEHGHLAHYPKLYDELVRVPLVVDHPHGEGGRVEEAVGLGSVPATVCDALGVDAGGRFAGESLLGVREGEAANEAPVTAVAVRGDSVTQQPIPRRLDDGELLVRASTPRWTYIYHTERDAHELYDRRTDPAQQENVWTAHADSALGRRLHEAARDRLAATGDGEQGPDASEETPDELSTQLEALGYL